jgi:hypothetical protein
MDHTSALMLDVNISEELTNVLIDILCIFQEKNETKN